MKQDYTFDERVARCYNRQRAHPSHVSDQIGEMILQQVGEGTTLLEIGVGTGRIAWPIVDRGIQVTGIDLSLNMLDEVFQDREADTFHLAQADMHRLPFSDDTFDAVLAVHVLHLAHDWQQVLREIARVLRPNGQFLQGRDWIDPESVVGDLRDELRRFVMSVAPNMKPPSAGISKDDFLASLSITDNTQVAEVVAAEWVGQISASERLYEIENRLDAESWGLPDSLFDEVLSHLQEYAANKWHDLEKKESVKRRFLLKTTRGHW